MKPLTTSLSLTEQVYQAIIEEILEGRIVQGEHLVQEQLASKLGVSRQPVQQAMALLKADGMVEDVGRRGLRVAGLDVKRMCGHYDIRAMLDAYAARAAAAAISSGKLRPKAYQVELDELFEKGVRAVDEQSFRDQLQYDEALHKLIYRMSGNPVLTEMAEPNWRYLRRVMAEALRLEEPGSTIWEQHRLIVDAIAAGDADNAARHAEAHVRSTETRLMSALTQHGLAAPQSSASVA